MTTPQPKLLGLLRCHPYVDCDNGIVLDDLRDLETETPIDDATVTFTLYQDGDPVASYENVAMPSLGAGRYIGTLDKDAGLVSGSVYVVEVKAISDTLQAIFRHRFTARYAR